MPLNVPDSWKSHIDQIVASPGVTVVVGDVDTGKTSFCVLLANRATQSGVSTAVVDGDIGQSEIGPPTTVGMGTVHSEIQSLSDIQPDALHFVGTTSPVGHVLPLSTGMKRLAASADGSQLIIVDTPGLVRGFPGRKLHTNTIELLSPRHIVALQKAKEAEHFLRFFDTWDDCTIHRLPTAPGVRVKTPILRAQRRATRFHEYFERGNQHQLSMETIATSETWLHTGVPLEPRYLKFAEVALQAEVLHGEMLDKGIYLITKSDYNKHGVEALQEQFRTRNIIIVPASRYTNLLVALLGRHLETLSLGIVQKMSFRSQTISVYTPLRSMGPVRSLKFGITKIRPDGTEIGRLRPEEL